MASQPDQAAAGSASAPQSTLITSDTPELTKSLKNIVEVLIVFEEPA
jgi:hypothetical protein